MAAPVAPRVEQLDDGTWVCVFELPGLRVAGRGADEPAARRDFHAWACFLHADWSAVTGPH